MTLGLFFISGLALASPPESNIQSVDATSLNEQSFSEVKNYSWKVETWGGISQTPHHPNTEVGILTFTSPFSNNGRWQAVGGATFLSGHNREHASTVASGGIRWSGTHLFLEEQLGYTLRKTQSLSGSPEFATGLGWKFSETHGFRLMLRHISNAGFHAPNRGETMLVFGWLLP